MEIRHLKLLITISQCGSINSASQRLYISQPSLYNTVKRCEQELGFPVFIRTSKGVKLTEKGEKFIEIAQNITAEYKKIQALSDTNKTVSISFIYLSYILEALFKFQEQGFLLSDMFRRTDPVETINDVICQKAHIGVMPVYQGDFNGFAEEIKQYNLQYHMLFEAVQLYVIVSQTHSLAGKKSISISEALEYPLTYYTAVPKKSVLRNIYDSKRPLKVQNRDELFLVLKNNKHFSLLTLTSNSKNPEFCYIPITDNAFKMNVCAIFPSSTALSKQEIELLEFLKNTVHFI